jgi:hypothetical protein
METNIIFWILVICMFTVAMKAIIGVHWPWEKCDCCGKRMKEHRQYKDFFLH